MDFIAIDVETSNADLSSICQIGVVVFENGKPISQWETLVDPETHFDWPNVNVHGITSDLIKDAPAFPSLYNKLFESLSNQIVVHHMPFDRLAITRARARYGQEPINCRWLDTARVVRSAWPEFASKGYGLKNMASHLGISFRHHSAMEDARAAGEILVHAVNRSGIPVHEWPSQVSTLSSVAREKTRKGNPNGPLAGEVIVFTGSLSMSRTEAAELAAMAGCDVGSNVTKETTFVVVGGLASRELAVSDKSSKHRKAEELIGKGQSIRILSENDFAELVAIG